MFTLDEIDEILEEAYQEAKQTATFSNEDEVLRQGEMAMVSHIRKMFKIADKRKGEAK